MSPEYAIDGLFSVKSDVFSFGVIVLEILSGKKNRGFDHPDHDLNLLGHVSFRLNILFFSLPNFPFSYVSINKLKILSRHGNYGMKVGRWSWQITWWRKFLLQKCCGAFKSVFCAFRNDPKSGRWCRPCSSCWTVTIHRCRSLSSQDFTWKGFLQKWIPHHPGISLLILLN